MKTTLDKSSADQVPKRTRSPKAGKKSMSGGGSSPVLVMRLTPAQKAKVQSKGVAWLRGLIDAA